MKTPIPGTLVLCFQGDSMARPQMQMQMQLQMPDADGKVIKIFLNSFKR